MFKRGMAALALAAGAALGGLVAAPAANAAPAGCNSGALCAYWLTNYTSASGHGVQQVYQNNDDLTMYANFYNSAGGSLFNNGNSCNVDVYPGTYHGGGVMHLDRGTGWTDVSAGNLPHIESNYWCTY
ncbi:peptidase inhibitor family I36 protein [Streptacidiphilus melanogenes]|uniref:peptidase inhibitor family I36 protein n=1 Tax=Streptacidiphilus melanogenes TaxID=411235 RepID=UPI001F1F22B5|nr:peptidase inhibitor family I36 protein [Streptacidiphilus melanogenes]